MTRRPLAGLLLMLASCSTEQEAVSESQAALKLTGPVVDAAGILDADTETLLTTKLEAAKRQFGQQLVVATTPSLEGKTIENYSIDLARAWKIGREQRNDGLLLVVAPKERKVRIEVGYGLEASFTDQFCGRILADNILPRFKSGDLQGGIVAGVDRMIAKMKAVPSKPANDNGAVIRNDAA